ncbi:uncharacterized protein LOC143859232 isoform X1 [Tasmannia lanceolata]|uniref:uncharacterized protein LOC143859232 isoform X1 n=1 Tax=Tasmannia lanceolata TaxID=3420 RepID=UPI0040635A41
MACAYFENALAEEGVRSDQGMLNLVEDNQLLMADPSEEEIREAIFSCPLECGSGPDSFHGFFDSSCWDLIKSDILLAATAFFKGGSLSRHYSSTFLALIPKTEDPKEDDARSSRASSPESTGSVETSISSPFAGMSYPSLFSSRPTGYGSSKQSGQAQAGLAAPLLVFHHQLMRGWDLRSEKNLYHIHHLSGKYLSRLRIP